MHYKIYKALTIVILLTLVKSCLKAQDAPISQFYSNLVVLNPAFAGTTASDRINTFYRNQWLRTDAGYHTFGAVYDKSFSEYNSGAGIVLTNEVNGAFVSPTIDGIYSYQVKVTNDISASMAMQAGITQKYLRSSDLVFDDELINGFTSENITPGFSKIIPDFALGAVVFYKNIYSGFSFDHIAQPYQGINKTVSGVRLNRKYTGFIGYIKQYSTYLIGEQRILSPNLLIQIQGVQQNINWGFSFQYDKLVGGLWLRHNIKPNFDALIVSAGYKTLNHKFAYSYDINVGKKSTLPLGAHEISFTMLFERPLKKKPKSIKCPTFLE